jgi:hypothetical protein
MLPKELSETVNRSRKDIAMVKRKETNEQTTIYKSSRVIKTVYRRRTDNTKAE